MPSAPVNQLPAAKNSFWRTLRVRLTLLYSLLLVLVLVVTLVAVRIVSYQTMLDDIDERLSEDLIR